MRRLRFAVNWSTLRRKHLISLGRLRWSSSIDEQGHVQLRQAGNLHRAGPWWRACWALVGLLFLNPLLRALSGAGVGAASGALSDLGINDGFLRRWAKPCRRANAALCLLYVTPPPIGLIETPARFSPRQSCCAPASAPTTRGQLRELLEKSRQQAEALRLVRPRSCCWGQASCSRSRGEHLRIT